MDHDLDARQTHMARHFGLRLAAVPGGHVSYRERGAGAHTVVLLHGIGSGSASWLDVAERLDGVRVLAWDAPGYGASSLLPQATPLASDYAHVLLQFLQAVQVQTCTLVGHSLGALMAAACAAEPAAPMVRSLVLISPARGYGADATTAQRTLGERLGALEQLGVEGLARERSARLLSAGADDRARSWVRWNMARLNPEGYRAAVHMLCADDIARYTKHSVPVQVHCGQDDQITTPASCAEVARLFGTTCRSIASAGHASPVEAADSVARLLRGATGHGEEVHP